MSNEFRNILETLAGEVNIDEIQNAIDRIVEEEPDNVTEGFLKEVNFWRKLSTHPLLRVVIDWGNLLREIKKSEHYKKLDEKLINILKLGEIKEEDIIEIKNLLKVLKDEAMDFITRQTGKVEQGLRHIHAPGSVAKKEGRNLYFGEQFTQEVLYNLAARLCSSIALGDNLGIYSEDKDLMQEHKQLAVLHFNSLSPFKIELKDLGVNEHETNHPYVVFLKFILRLVKMFYAEENYDKKKRISLILDRLKTSTVSLFFMPPNKEKWCTIMLPRLDLFINKWIMNEESRERIEMLFNVLHNFIDKAAEEAGKKRESKWIRNLIDILMGNCDVLCYMLIEYSVPDFYSLRNIMDIMVDLGTRYDLKLYLKPLELATRY